MLAAAEAAWELSYHYAPMWETLRTVDSLWRARAEQAPSDADRGAMAAVLALLHLTDLKIVVENELTCAATTRLATAAREVTHAALAATRAADWVRPHHPELAELVAGKAATAHRYYSALAVAAAAAADLLQSGDPGPSLIGAIAALADAESDVDRINARDRSELRAHRFSLQALAESTEAPRVRAPEGHAAPTEAPWLTIDHGRVVYLYPFGIRGMPARSVVDLVRQHAQGWELAGVRPDSVSQTLDIDDVWSGSDFLGRRFEGAAIVLPPIELADLDGSPLATFEAELRFSLLGNHYLRLEATLEEASPQELYAALFRAAPEHGSVRVSCGGAAATWPWLAEFAVDVIGAVPRCLGEGMAASVRPGMYHVVVSVVEASLGVGPGQAKAMRRPATNATEVTAAVGAQALLHPIVNGVGAIAEWIRYQPDSAEILADVGLAGDLVARNCNTTVLVMLGTPNFMVGMHSTVAEFAASLDGLFGAWSDELATYYDRVMTRIPDLRATARPQDAQRPQDLRATARPQGAQHPELSRASTSPEKLAADAQFLEYQQLRLHDFVAEARSVLALIRSPR